jgi:ribosomal protein S16
MPTTETEQQELATQAEVKTEITTLEEAIAEIQRKTDNEKRLLQEKAEVKRKLSKFEAEVVERDAKLLEEQGKFKELYETERAKRDALELRIKEEKVTNSLKTALQEAGARVPDTVMKLIDKAQVQFDDTGNVILDTVKSAVESLRKADPVLFGAANAGLPPAARATEGNVQDSFAKEVAAAKNINELQAVYAKYQGTKFK